MKNEPVRQLQPAGLWNHFADLNAIPRASKQEARIIEFVRQFGQSLGLTTVVDDTGNVIIRKPAQGGLDDRLPVVLQSHLDMVHQKNADVDFDFDQQGIRMVLEGDWVAAAGTTLGADNGIGVASIMALLASTEIPHPPLEGLFTIDEETGMTGAQGLVPGALEGRILLNLDTEDDDELTIGCAGGVDITGQTRYETGAAAENHTGYRIRIRGLSGGHSGMDIHLGRGNANKIMNRILWHATMEFQVRVAGIDGGGLRNAIPRESTATLALASGQATAFGSWFEARVAEITAEYRTTDPDLSITATPVECPATWMPEELQHRMLSVLYGCPNGIYRMSPEVPDLVQTSNNLARVELGDGQLTIGCLTRSSVNSERDDLANAIRALFQMLGADITLSGDYPGWKPVPGSGIVRLMSALHEEMFGATAHVAACHAGLECGIIGSHYPEMEMISFGPNIRGAHSPDERVQISSVQKFWKFLVETLNRIPVANTLDP